MLFPLSRFCIPIRSKYSPLNSIGVKGLRKYSDQQWTVHILHGLADYKLTMESSMKRSVKKIQYHHWCSNKKEEIRTNCSTMHCFGYQGFFLPICGIQSVYEKWCSRRKYMDFNIWNKKIYKALKLSSGFLTTNSHFCVN